MDNNSKGTIWLTGDILRIPKGNASTNRMSEIAKGFMSNGYKVKLVPLIQPKDDVRGIYNGVGYEYYYQQYKDPTSKWMKRFLRHFRICKKVNFLAEICKRDNVKLIYCGTSSITTLRILKKLKQEVKLTITYDVVEDPLSSWLAKEVKHYSIKEWLQHLINLFRLPFIYFYAWRLPDFICAITNNLRKRVAKFGINENRIITFPITKFISDKNLIENKVHSDSKIKNTIIHSGSTYFPKDGIWEILDSIRILKDRGINIKLDFYGPIGCLESKMINQYSNKYQLEDRIEIKGLVNLPILYEAQSNALCLVCFKPLIRQNRYNFATKLIDYMDSGRPMILSNLPVHKSVFENSVNALICEKNTGKALADKIEFVYRNKKLATQIGKEGRNTLKTEFNSLNLTKMLLKTIIQN